MSAPTGTSTQKSGECSTAMLTPSVSLSCRDRAPSQKDRLNPSARAARGL
jgi:hypothetical protein